MRLYIHTTPSVSAVPFDYQRLLLGVLHKWIGKNNAHDDLSLYSFSWIQGGRSIQGGLQFPGGADWFISMHDKKLLEQCLNGMKATPGMFHGLTVTDVQIRESPAFGQKQTFFLAGPVLVKQWDGTSVKHLTWEDEQSGHVMTQTLETKLNKANIRNKAAIRFDRSYKQPKTKLVTINTIKNRASLCPVIIEGDPEAIGFAWDVGVGHSTGSGFGALQ